MISSIGSGSYSFDALARTSHAGSKLGSMRGRSGGDSVPALTIRTQEGDTVTISAKQSKDGTYSRPTGSLASTGLTSNDQFDVTVTGNLSDAEKADIQAVLQKMDSARSSMESGDFQAGMAAMQSAMAGGGTVASVDGPKGPPPGGMGAGGAGGASGACAKGGSSSDLVSSLLSSDDDDDDSDSNWQALLDTGSSSTSSTNANTIQQLLDSLRSQSYSLLRGDSNR